MNVEHAKEDLFEIKRVFDSLNIPFWLNGGTLMAAVRDKHFFDWDHDLDILIRHSDYTSELPEKFTPFFGYKTLNYGLGRTTVFDLKRVSGVRTNVFLLFRNTRLNKYVKVAPPFTNCYKTLIPFELLDTENYVEFLGQKFRVPIDPESFLENHYGADWRTPIKSGLGWRKHWEYVSQGEALKGVEV